ncbi:BadF/BadG/BcrA/BcrD ATPase family protein [Rathayibacter soli]|uniref:BadF/BadG/BcrA/BcrD ATPase family protein n=1 Tax=Rathayibacter soli TaxID=3144168 RepID=UPI0027E3B4C1|nr:BadF/BadG/BcrA/BcrD ATPase family protein [Glaciibacter superstes]
MSELFLGVDAGNSKTLAAVADDSGRILGFARGGLGDIYGAATPQDAVNVVCDVLRQAVANAGAGLEDLRAAAFRLAGVDWPEDAVLWKEALAPVLARRTTRSISNDGLALLRCGDTQGIGVAISLGTGAAIGARGSAGEEFVVSWWFQRGFGATGLGSDAVKAVMLAELGLAEETALSAALLEFYRQSTVEGLLHAFTNRNAHLGHIAKGSAARTVLATAQAGDPVAMAIVADHAAAIANYAAVSAARVDLQQPTIVLGGSVLAATDSVLRRALTAELSVAVPGCAIVATGAVPILGTVLDAMAEGGIALNPELQAAVLSASIPEGLLAT